MSFFKDGNLWLSKALFTTRRTKYISCDLVRFVGLEENVKYFKTTLVNKFPGV